MTFGRLAFMVACGIGAVSGAVFAAFAAVHAGGLATLNRLLALWLSVLVARMARPLWVLAVGHLPPPVEALSLAAFGLTPLVFLVYLGTLTRHRGEVARRFLPVFGLSAPFVAMAWLAGRAPASFRLFMSLAALSAVTIGVAAPLVARFLRRARPRERAAARWALGVTSLMALVTALHVVSVLAGFDAWAAEAAIVSVAMCGAAAAEVAWGLLGRVHDARDRDLYPEGDPVVARLMALMEDERVFLDPRLTLASLARRLKVPTHSLSRLLSHRVGLTFADYVDQHRADEFKRRMSEWDGSEARAELLASSCGFASAGALEEAFHRLEHLSPADFVERQRSRTAG